MTNRIEEKRKGFEEKIGKVFFLIEAKSSDEAKEKPEEMLKNIMIKDLIAKDKAMV